MRTRVPGDRRAGVPSGIWMARHSRRTTVCSGDGMGMVFRLRRDRAASRLELNTAEGTGFECKKAWRPARASQPQVRIPMPNSFRVHRMACQLAIALAVLAFVSGDASAQYFG